MATETDNPEQVREPPPPPPRVRVSFGEGNGVNGADNNDDDEDDNGKDHRKVDSPPPPPYTSLTPKFSSKELRSNLMREQKNRDPLFYYEVVTVLGVGSMGSVAKVRKREDAVGGSARKHLQAHFKREKRFQQCLQIPLIGGLFQFCMKIQRDSDRDVIASIRGMKSDDSSTVLHTKAAAVEDYNEQYLDGDNLSTSAGSAAATKPVLYAMKSIHLSRVTDPTFLEELKNEVRILRNLDHPHIVRPIETFYHRNQLFMVMELCTGGDLYARDPYTEEEAARITSSILSAIAYMHTRDICHRDLKYENILFVNNSPTAEVKLIDFGLSVRFGGDELTDGVGTIYTMSPEVLKGSYTKQADCWSIGVITYMLLSSQMPFYGRKRRHIVEQIMNGNYEFRGRRWRKISSQAKEFVESLLVVDPDERATPDEAQSQTWLNKRFAATVRNPYAHEVDNAQKSLQRFSNYSKLKKVALMVVAHKSSTEEIGILRKLFQQYDTEKKGVLSYKEFKTAFDTVGYSSSECRKMFDACDIDGSGKIRYTEFLAATLEAHGAISEERLAEAFDRLDSDDSGFISAENLREILGADFPPEEVEEIINEADLTKDGKISYTEFLALWEDKNETRRETMIQEISLLPSDHGSSVSFEEYAESESSEGVAGSSHEVIISRANFIEKKLRRPSDSKNGSKHVLFDEDVKTIPQAEYSEDNPEKRSSESSTTMGQQQPAVLSANV